jgi:hypothetical protein
MIARNKSAFRNGREPKTPESARPTAKIAFGGIPYRTFSYGWAFRPKNDLRRPKMEEIGDRTTVFEFGGLRDRQRDYIDWVLKASLEEGTAPDDVLTDEAATLLAAKLKTPLQIGQHLVRAFEAGFEIGAKPIAAGVVEAVLSRKRDELEAQLTRNGYDLRSLVEQFDAKPAEIRQLLRGDLDAGRTQELMDEMRAAGLPT